MRDKKQPQIFSPKYQLFYSAILNEIAVDRELLERIGKGLYPFTPVRSLKVLPILERFKVGGTVYRSISFIFALFIPFLIFLQFLLSVASLKKNKLKGVSREALLIANGRANSIFSQEFPGRDVTLININQKKCKAHITNANILNLVDLTKVFAESLIGFSFFLIKNRDISNIPQLYVTFNWFLTYRAMRKIYHHIDLVYFSNHYDRWAVLFDGVFHDRQLCLLQHGVLPEKLNLPYKLKNLSIIYAIDNDSELKFRQLYSLLKGVEFRRRLIALSLSEIDGDFNSVLIIGQPHSINREVSLIRLLKSELPDIVVFIKPHPLYGKKQYEAENYGNVISEKEYYPKVDIAICLESTLGVEYEQAGVEVLWWQDTSPEQMLSELKERFC